MHRAIPIGVGVLGGVIIILAGVLGWVVIPKVIDSKIKEETRLKIGGETLEKWADIPYPIYLVFYVHNVTNPDEVEAGFTPKLQEVGPYSFRQQRLKLEFSQADLRNPENTLQYKEQKTYFWDQSTSGSNSQDDLVNIINLPLVAVVSGLRDRGMSPTITELVANFFLASEKLIRRNVRVGDLLFDGFDVSTYSKNPLLASQLPEEFSNHRFGLYKGENGTLSEEYNVYTGVDDSDDFGRIKTYKGGEDLEFWVRNTECDKVKGTDGSLFAPFFTKDRKFDVFSSDLCRSLDFAFDSETEVRDVKTYRFVVPKWTLEDPRINTDNQCYCLDADPEDCPHAGLISLSGCRNGAPIMMSTPYFLDGFDEYRKLAGMPEPVREKHVTYLDIEPNSGVLMRGHKRIQVNVQVKIGSNVQPKIQAFSNLTKDMVFPIVWADENAEIDEESTDELKSKLLKPLKIVDITKWTGIGVGIALVCGGMGLFYVSQKQAGVTI